MFFNYDEKLKNHVKTIPGSVFSSTHRCFYVKDSEENLKLVMKTLKDAANIDISFLVSRQELSGETEIQPERSLSKLPRKRSHASYMILLSG